MGSYLIGVGAAFLNPILHGWANIFDSYLSNKVFRRLTTLIFYTQLTNLVFIPVVLLVDFPQPVSFHALSIIVSIALIEVFYQYPYFRALRKGDTSVVASLFSLGKIFIPLLAFILVSERLTVLQYIGFFVVTLASVSLTIDLKKFRINESFWLMLVVSIALAGQGVLFKYLFDQGVSWGSAMVWTSVAQFVIAGAVILCPPNLKDLFQTRHEVRRNGWMFFGAQCLTWGGNALEEYAVFLLPVSVVNGITSAQPIFVLLFAVLFTKKFPGLFTEYLGSGSVAKKVGAYIFMALGTILITANIF